MSSSWNAANQRRAGFRNHFLGNWHEIMAITHRFIFSLQECEIEFWKEFHHFIHFYKVSFFFDVKTSYGSLISVPCCYSLFSKEDCLGLTAETDLFWYRGLRMEYPTGYEEKTKTKACLLIQRLMVIKQKHFLHLTSFLLEYGFITALLWGELLHRCPYQFWLHKCPYQFLVTGCANKSVLF